MWPSQGDEKTILGEPKDVPAARRAEPLWPGRFYFHSNYSQHQEDGCVSFSPRAGPCVSLHLALSTGPLHTTARQSQQSLHPPALRDLWTQVQVDVYSTTITTTTTTKITTTQDNIHRIHFSCFGCENLAPGAVAGVYRMLRLDPHVRNYLNCVPSQSLVLGAGSGEIKD